MCLCFSCAFIRANWSVMVCLVFLEALCEISNQDSFRNFSHHCDKYENNEFFTISLRLSTLISQRCVVSELRKLFFTHNLALRPHGKECTGKSLVVQVYPIRQPRLLCDNAPPSSRFINAIVDWLSLIDYDQTALFLNFLWNDCLSKVWLQYKYHGRRECLYI